MATASTDTLPPPPKVSKKTIPMAGLLVDVYGLEELSTPVRATQVTCLWLHHPRLQTRAIMGAFGRRAVDAWNEKRRSAKPDSIAASRGLVALAFDQRNHGSRLVDELANESWKKGNETHALDMMGAVRGMVDDTRGLIDIVEGYMVNAGAEGIEVDTHYVLGKSLGGHSAWQLMFADPRVTVGVMIIGCPDYMSLMSNRARKSKLPTYKPEDDGTSFLGSRHFPRDLVEVCRSADPKGLVFGTTGCDAAPQEPRREEIAQFFDRTIKGKKFLACSGGADKLVPHSVSEPFMKFFQAAATGWYKDGGVSVEDRVYEGVGHTFSEGMVRDALEFLMNAMEDGSREDKARI